MAIMKNKKESRQPAMNVKQLKKQDVSELSIKEQQFLAMQSKPKGKLAEKKDMYEMIIANLVAGEELQEPDMPLESGQLAIGFNNIASETQINKYFIIQNLPDFIKTQFIDQIRGNCIQDGLKINFFFFCEPHTINWDSAEMKNKLRIWGEYSKENAGAISTFEYRAKRSVQLARQRIINSTRYLNIAEMEQRRTLMKVTIVMEIAAQRNEEAILNMVDSVRRFKALCRASDIRARELRVNMIDWLQAIGIFHMRAPKEVTTKLTRRIFTDDNLAMFNGYKQGRVGDTGIPLGMDIRSNLPVIWKFKADPDAAENWLISAATGGGKSYFVKCIITYLLADNFVVTIMDYEGDEYTNLAAYISNANKQDVKVISMGKGSTGYYDPVQIPELTGDIEVDETLKEEAISYIMSVFRIIISGLEGVLSIWEEGVVSAAIARVYDSAGVTEDPNTWSRSRGLSLHDVYEEIVHMTQQMLFIDEASDNQKHKSAVKIVESGRTYFSEDGAKKGTFENPMSAEELFKAKLIIFSFGVKGGSEIQVDPVQLALKQLSVANLATQISNHCKYVKRCFNVKVWEEYQRWGSAKGSAEIIGNAMTGGRKRGDVNFLITNDLAQILDEENKVAKRLSQNIQNYAIGYIKSKSVREDFCREYDLQECAPTLYKIAREHKRKEARKGSTSRKNVKKAESNYLYAFCVVLESGKKAVVKVKLPGSLASSKLFKTGVSVDRDKQ